MSDFDELPGVIGPECSISIAVPSEAHRAQLVSTLTDSVENGGLAKWFQDELSKRACSSMDAYLQIHKIVVGKFKVVEEWPPELNMVNGEIDIQVSISVCHEDDDHDDLSAAIYSEEFERYYCREVAEITSKILQEKLPWFSASYCRVTIDGIGEN